jgi:hypothetical protein
MAPKTSIYWNYVKDGICQVRDANDEICGKSVSMTKASNVERHIERFHKTLFEQLEKDKQANEPTKPKIDNFFIKKSGPLEELALTFATSTMPISMLKNDRFKVILL